jgi:hypothetical protein
VLSGLYMDTQLGLSIKLACAPEVYGDRCPPASTQPHGLDIHVTCGPCHMVAQYSQLPAKSTTVTYPRGQSGTEQLHPGGASEVVLLGPGSQLTQPLLLHLPPPCLRVI